MLSLLDLPADLLESIADRLKPQDTVRLRQVAKPLRSVGDSWNSPLRLAHWHDWVDKYAAATLRGLMFSAGNLPTLRALYSIDLAGRQLGDAAASHLCQALGQVASRPLRRLDLSDNCLTAQSAPAIAACGALSALHFLDLTRNCLGQAGMAAVLQSVHLGHTRRIAVDEVGLALLLGPVLGANLPLLKAFEQLRDPHSAGHRFVLDNFEPDKDRDGEQMYSAAARLNRQLPKGRAPWLQTGDLLQIDGIDLSSLHLQDFDLLSWVALPQMNGVQQLLLADNSLKDLRHWLGHPHLRQLRHLSLSCNPLEAWSCELLWEPGKFSQLEVLDLSNLHCTAADKAQIVAGLGAATNLVALSNLNLSYNRLQAAELQALGKLNMPNFLDGGCLILQGQVLREAGVKHLFPRSNQRLLGDLCLAGSRLGAAGAAYLFQSAFMPWLAYIDLQGTGIGGGLGMLCSWDGLNSIYYLNLSNNLLQPGDYDALSRAPLYRLQRLFLGSTPMHSSGLRALMEADWWCGLDTLDAPSAQIDGLQLEAAGPRWPHSMQRLQLSYNPLGAAGVRCVTAAPQLASSLYALQMNSAELTDASVCDLLDAFAWRHLRHLELEDNGLGRAAAERLGSGQGLPRLNILRVQGNAFTEAEQQDLQNSVLSKNLSQRLSPTKTAKCCAG